MRLAQSPQDLHAAQRLRYEVFVAELGGDGALVDHEARLERDAFDPDYDHLILVDDARDPALGTHVVGVYRLLRSDVARRIGRYYSEDEYDLSVLKSSGRTLLELGRSCVHADYRGGKAMMFLWGGLADYVADHGVEILFGVASFHGTDIPALSQPLSLLHHRYLAPENLRVKAIGESAVAMDILAQADIDRPRATREIPNLIKAYLRLGGYVGQGAFVDHAFNTTDVCLVMDTDQMSKRAQSFYTKRYPL